MKKNLCSLLLVSVAMAACAVQPCAEAYTAGKEMTAVSSAAADVVSACGISTNLLLRTGSRGSAVYSLQRNLTGMGYPCGTIDGIFGAKTDTAVRSFQRDYGLQVDGIAGKGTLSKINEKISQLQTGLNKLGFQAGTPDGLWGTKTNNALLGFQRKYGYPANGIASKSMIDAVVNKANQPAPTPTPAPSNRNSQFAQTASKVCLYTLSANGNQYITKNFRVKEYACKDGSNIILIDKKLAALLQDLRTHFGKPVIINSAYRHAEYNARVGGAKNSYHTKGMAADVVVQGVSPLEVARYAQSLGVKGIGLYGSFTHLDTRTTKYYWDQRSGSERPVGSF